MADTAKTNPLYILAIALAHKRAYRHLQVASEPFNHMSTYISLPTS